MSNGSRFQPSRFIALENAHGGNQLNIEVSNEQQLEKDFVPCSSCCPQVNQTVVLVALSWILMKFAFFLILIGLLSTFLGSVLCFVISGRKLDLTQVSKYWRMLLLFSFLHALGLSFNNLSSQVSGLTLNQIVRSALPLVTLLASWYFEGQVFTKKMIMVTSFLVVAALLALYKNPEFGIIGFLCSIGALFCQTFETIVVSMLLRRTTFSAIDVALMTSIPSAMMVVIPFYVFELDGVISNATQNTGFTVSLLVASSVLAFLSYVIHFSLIWYTSSLYSVVIGHLKIVLLLISSMIVFGTTLVPINYVGIVLVILGFIVLNIVRLQELKQEITPTLSYNDSPAITMDMLESKDTTFAQPRDD